MLSKLIPYLAIISILIVVFVIASGFHFMAANRYHKEIPLSNERELKVTLEAGLGKISISRGKTSTILDAGIESDKSFDLTDCIDYSVRDRIGFLSVNTNGDLRKKTKDEKKKHSFHFGAIESSSWNMHLTDAVPIAFDVELGVGKGEFDFTGLMVKDLTMSTGASSVYLRFDKQNKSVIEDLTIESGLSQFHGEGLCNANFNHLKFEGGVGSYLLDFSGLLDKEVDVDIQVGLGSLTVIIPENIGAKIMYEKSWITHISLDKDFSEREESNYFSSNYSTAGGRMNMKIEAGLGSVKIRHEP
jgi:hypothetical protein